MKNIFTEHPKSIGETYFQHMFFAFSFGINMLLGGLACVIHAIFPFLFVKTASNFLLKMTENFVKRAPKNEARLVCLAKCLDEKISKCTSENHAA